MIAWSASRASGTWWFRVGGVIFVLNAPWKKALFSEREGFDWYFPRRRVGWRIAIKIR